jgi:hypothetical protein
MYRHILTDRKAKVLSRSSNRVIVLYVDDGSRYYFDTPDFNAQFRAITEVA